MAISAAIFVSANVLASRSDVSTASVSRMETSSAIVLSSLFEMSRNRLEYLCLLFGKPVPADAALQSRRNAR